MEIIYKVRKSHSLRAIPQLSIQLTKLDVLLQPPGTYGVETLDTYVIGLLRSKSDGVNQSWFWTKTQETDIILGERVYSRETGPIVSYI